MIKRLKPFQALQNVMNRSKMSNYCHEMTVSEGVEKIYIFHVNMERQNNIIPICVTFFGENLFFYE